MRSLICNYAWIVLLSAREWHKSILLPLSDHSNEDSHIRLMNAPLFANICRCSTLFGARSMEKWGLADYPKLIKHPMDLGTMKVSPLAWSIKVAMLALCYWSALQWMHARVFGFACCMDGPQICRRTQHLLAPCLMLALSQWIKNGFSSLAGKNGGRRLHIGGWIWARYATDLG